MSNPGSFRAAVHIAREREKNLAEKSAARVTDVTAIEFAAVSLDSGVEKLA
jgi:hypothetical protein